ncbi:cell division site-positioning protein MapZ family protein [Streptococcus merionis]|uniref:cell division site-positioning protein MapZ family protein n=1 Tax=Streptococcus merionis TaxID=400065 RepID=UPI0035173008
MSDKNKSNLPEDAERILDLEDAKEMTVAQAAKTQGEIEAGITEDDSLLDRYIKQHRDEIEADKFETKKIREEELVQASALAGQQESPDLDETIAVPVTPVDSSLSVSASQAPTIPSTTEDDSFDDFPENEEYLADERAEKRRKMIGLLLAALALLGIGFTLYSQRNALSGLFGSDRSSNSTTRSSTSSSSSSQEESAPLKAFNELYGTFFTNDAQTALKNDSFEQLSALETALATLEGTAEYESAKAKFDKLKAAIEAIQAVNSQFDKAVLVNGEIDTTATVKPDVAFATVTTGISSIDAAITAAVNFGRSQQENASAGAALPSQGSAGAAETTPSAPASTSSASSKTVTLSNGIVLDYGKRVVYGSDQVALKRELSRVPYNDEVIADAHNEAWEFAPGVLEKIIATSNQRGYFSGNEFILEKVNIINGRGYYNMFRTDGTYLFSINAKTGYFVGNGAGYSDALDF